VLDEVPLRVAVEVAVAVLLPVCELDWEPVAVALLDWELVAVPVLLAVKLFEYVPLAVPDPDAVAVAVALLVRVRLLLCVLEADPVDEGVADDEAVAELVRENVALKLGEEV
jgi:hypothetical protein